MLRSVPVAFILAVAVVSDAQTQGSPTPQQLNREGRWSEAASLAERQLASPGSLSLTEKCELRAMLAYAYSKTDRRREATEQASRGRAECLPLGEHWTIAEFSKITDAGPAGRSLVAGTDDGWTTARPEAIGLDTVALAEHRTLCDQSGADACLVAHDGRIVQEWYGPDYTEPMMTMSSVKSWTAILAVLLVIDGKLDLRDPVSKWIPEWKAGSEGGVTVHHLLTMTSGLENRTAAGKSSVGGAGDKNAFVFALPLSYRPGARWAYSNEGSQLLSPILERAAGIPLERYARERLFAPLEMQNTELRLDQADNPWTYADANTTLRDFAKVCQLILDRGRWRGRQIIPAAWVDSLTRPIAQNPGYGMSWWLSQDPVVQATGGYLNTDCYAVPELRLVVARMQNTPRPSARLSYRTASTIGPDVVRLWGRIVGRPR